VVVAALVAFELAVVLGSGSHQHRTVAPPAVTGHMTGGPFHPAAPLQPAAQSTPKARPPRGAFLIGRVLSPLHTSAGLILPRTPLGDDTWLLILRHRGDRGVALVPTKGEPRPAAVNLAKLQLRWTRIRITVHLSRLRLVVRRGTHLLGAFPIAAGTPSTPTPTGRFSVTDRIIFPHPSTYGSFALGLSARQTHLVPGWTGGDQVAIHGTDHPETIGTYASLGCIRVSEAALRVLRRAVPLGAPVVIGA
jgi:L,D-transpeptidase catalytic domain